MSNIDECPTWTHLRDIPIAVYNVGHFWQTYQTIKGHSVSSLNVRLRRWTFKIVLPLHRLPPLFIVRNKFVTGERASSMGRANCCAVPAWSPFEQKIVSDNLATWQRRVARFADFKRREMAQNSNVISRSSTIYSFNPTYPQHDCHADIVQPRKQKVQLS